MQEAVQNSSILIRVGPFHLYTAFNKYDFLISSGDPTAEKITLFSPRFVFNFAFINLKY